MSSSMSQIKVLFAHTNVQRTDGIATKNVYKTALRVIMCSNADNDENA